MRFWIDDGKVMGSSNPTTDALESLYREGFRTIVCLLDEPKQAPDYDLKQIHRIGFARHCIPIQDFTAPSQEQIKQFIRLAAAGTGKILVHCMAGIGRTGTMGAAYWIWNGLKARDAMARIRKENPFAVESEQQRECLYEFEAFARDPEGRRRLDVLGQDRSPATGD